MRAALDEGKHELTALYKSEGRMGKNGLINPLEIFCGVFWPTLVFLLIVRLIISPMRYNYATFVLVIGLIIPVSIQLYMTTRVYANVRHGRVIRWRLVLNIVMWLSMGFAYIRGDKLYWKFARSYYQFQDMASYINISPTTDRGQSYMDAGQVYFKEGARVEVSKAIAFQEDQIYCVAPIVQETMDSKGDQTGVQKSGDQNNTADDQNNAAGGNKGKGSLKLPKSGTVDFWAVGMNCCDPSGLNFKCGDSTKPFARAGIRVLRDDTRPFFLMAVQEWTAWLHMPAKHPLFFHWVQDPLLEVDNFWFNAKRYWLFNTLYCMMFCCLGTLLLHLIAYNLGF
jgi:hypothetical protein